MLLTEAGYRVTTHAMYPTRGDERRACLAIALALLLGVILCWLPSQASAQDEALMLARTCVSERGWRVDTNDCAAIYEVALNRATSRGIPLARAMRELSPRLHGAGPMARLWLRGLEANGRRPWAWPAASWARHRPMWLATYDEALELVAGAREPVCERPPVSWGAPWIVDARERRGGRWEAVACGETLNSYGRWL
jgi:hypothetical protein